ncbi:MAG: Flagellar biosynthesis protein FlhA [Fimbriimonadaceae bacterium]|nr:Flagellar biosynthesis protein FlhA [Fimbriimonadaceae bacterium]
MSALQRLLRHTDVLVGLGLLVIVAMLILPLPHWMLDFGLVIAIASSLLILLAAVNVQDPMQFSVFPSLLLITTLFRLALSIAATKLILGTGQGGQVIATFGKFVMGGDFVVGFVAFLILMIVQFVVITTGAGRVAEVVARFTLDAMPGKQMAIDADLAAGLINEEQARERRKQVKQEADFYGAMDGASKFVKGDAIAALLIIAVNIIGGFVVGLMRGGGDAMQILQTYALMSVGEGLVSQIPALLISTASGLLVTRSGQDRTMGGAVIGQLGAQPKAIGSAGVALLAFALVPGFPATLFGLTGAAMLLMHRYLSDRGKRQVAITAAAAQQTEGPPPGPESVLSLLNVDALEIEIGYGLTRLADRKAGGDLPDRITATRRQLALDFGYVMPSVRIRDSIQLAPDEYVLKVRGEEVARAEARTGQVLAIPGGAITQQVFGHPTKEPVFGLDALWIDENIRGQAEQNGYTVIEPSAMISTHLAEVVRQHASELLTRQDVLTLVENAKQINQAVVEELVPHVVPIGDVQKVLQHLLRERVPIRDMVTILETMADFAPRVKDPDQLGELVRASIARTITRQHLDVEGKLYCVTLEPTLERQLIESIQQTAGGSLVAWEPALQQQVVDKLREESERGMAMGREPVLLCSAQLRLPLKRAMVRYLPQLNLLAYNEVSEKADVEFVAQVAA